MSKRRQQRLERKVLKAYYDPRHPGSYGGIERLHKATGVPTKIVRRILQKNLAYSLHKPVRRTFTTLPTVAHSIDHQWVADLVDMQKLSRWNRGTKYLLTVIDVLSKYAWVEPIKNKTGAELVRAFRQILRSKRKPVQLQTDKGTEFTNRVFQAFLQDKDIRHFTTEGDTKAATVERFNRTLKERMYRAFTANNSYEYVEFLPDLVDSYNDSVHRSIGLAPSQVSWKNDAQVWKRLYGKKRMKPKSFAFRVGDWVRLSKARRTFKKGYLPGWTEEVFRIRSRRFDASGVPVYKLKEYDNTWIRGTFYQPELQKAQVSPDDFFRVEKILKRRGQQVYVQWKGWPTKYNSWINKTDLVPIGPNKS